MPIHFLVLDNWPAYLFEPIALARPREIRTLTNLRYKLLLVPFNILNCTKKMKYEASERKCSLRARMPQLGSLKYSSSVERPALLGSFAPFH
jgi:hypothetical protein